MVEIRGIRQSFLKVSGNKSLFTRQLFIRRSQGIEYGKFDYPQDRPFNKGQVNTFIAKKLGCKPSDIFWPVHIKI